MHPITFTIGDWSLDGHEKYADTLVLSSLPVQDVRELHFSAEDTIGITIGKLCKEYEHNSLTPEQTSILNRLGLLDTPTRLPTTRLDEDDILTLWLRILVCVATHQGQSLTLVRHEPSPVGETDIAALEDLVAHAVRTQGLSLQVDIHGHPVDAPIAALITALTAAAKSRNQSFGAHIDHAMPDPIPTLHFFGQDAQKRHLEVPGYGVFTF